MTDPGGVLFAAVVKPARWPHTAPVDITAYHVHGEPISHEQAMAAAYETFAEGDAWGPAWDTTWFHVTGRVPEQWAGEDVVLNVHLGYGGGTGFGAEAQVWIDGRPVRGISPHHRFVPIAYPAVGGETFDFHIEAAANPPAPAKDPGPLLLADPQGEPLLILRRCHLAVVDREVDALVHDWSLVAELATWRSGEARDAARAALDAAAAAIDEHDVHATAPAARAALAGVLGATNPSALTSLAVGNSHLDTAWLWPVRETKRKAARTFSTASTLLDEHPDYRFAASQAQQFEWIRDLYPDLWARVLAHVKAGRFDLVGSMWVEPDCNIPSGESLVRQIVHGKRFFSEEMGIDTPGLWLPDVFGYSAALPQILALAGIDWFLTQKISWNQTNKFPHHTFWWEGIDGTRMFTHFPPADTYAGDFSVANMRHGARNFSQSDVRDLMIYLYGHGDGGGGPTVEMLERARRMADLDGVPRVELTTAGDAMARIRAEGDPDDLPVWVGELYLELHRGTYTTHGAVKKANRTLELALRDAEMWSLAATRLAGSDYPAEELDRAWKTVLLHQFHDIIPGSSIHWVYKDTAADHAEVSVLTDRIIEDALTAVAGTIDTIGLERPVIVANPLPFERREVVEVQGELHFVGAPACGWRVSDLAAPDPVDGPAVTAGEAFMDNGILRVEWDEAGLLTSVRHLETGREAIAPGARGNLLQLLDDNPEQWDAWDIDIAAFDTAADLTDLDRLGPVAVDEMEASLVIVRSFGASRIEQTVRLRRGSGRVEIHNSIDWHENHKLLKVAFGLDVRAASARHEIQFGHVVRSTHANTSWDAAQYETCAHTWVDLSEHGFGVALLNDSKYGHDVTGNTIRLSLLRSPTWPDPVADRGHHTFAYALFPHGGSFAEGGVIAEAHSFNSPLRVLAVGAAASTPTTDATEMCSLVEVDDPGVVVSAVKLADDGGAMIVRLHESFGGRRRVRLHIAGAVGAERVDLLEVRIGEEPCRVNEETVTLDLGVFELVTLRVALAD